MAVTDWLFGRILASDEEAEQRVGVLVGRLGLARLRRLSLESISKMEVF